MSKTYNSDKLGPVTIPGGPPEPSVYSHELAAVIEQRDDLLAACKAADGLLNDTTEVRKILRYAIAKAEGRAQ